MLKTSMLLPMVDRFEPPVCPRHPHERLLHDDVVVDDYDWLRDRDDPETVAYMEAESRYTEAMTAEQAELRASLFDDIRFRTRQTDLSVPDFVPHVNGTAFWYYSRTVEGWQYPLLCRIPASTSQCRPDIQTNREDEQLLLDINALASGHPFFSLGAADISPDGRLLAYAVDTCGDEIYDLRIRDLESGQDLPDEICGTGSALAWAGSDWLFYTRLDAALRPCELWRHRISTGIEADMRVMTEDDERFWMGVEDSRDYRWIVVGLGSKTTSEVWLLPTSDPAGTLHCVAPRRTGIEYEIDIADDRLFIVHNDGAEDFALAEAPVTGTSASDWLTVIPGCPGQRIIGVDAYRDTLVVSRRSQGKPGVLILPRLAGGGYGEPRTIDVGDLLATVDAVSSAELNPVRITLIYESLVTPRTVADFELATSQISVIKQTPVLDHPVFGRYRADKYIQEQRWASATDGARIPISIVRLADLPLDGTAPCLLHGYGAYEISSDPYFSIARLSLLDRGVVYAIAHVRGGGELGRQWYTNGKLLNKRNTFTDFISCAEELIALGYTGAGRLVAEGRSAGGLLMGAIANLRPDLFAGVHADVPFVDPLNTMLDDELPLTVTEWDEWGNPREDRVVYAYMKSYSPYENVSAHSYPAMLVTTSLHDSRVDVAEPLKWVARLRATATADPFRPLLLKIEMDAGHSGVSGRYHAWQDAAFEMAWILHTMNRSAQPYVGVPSGSTKLVGQVIPQS